MGGAKVTYIYQLLRTFNVQVTATDQAKTLTQTRTFTVSIGATPPTLTLYPDCAKSSRPCKQASANAGTPYVLGDTLTHGGIYDYETVPVGWGDGTDNTAAGGQDAVTVVGNPLTLTATANNLSFTVASTHT